MSEEVEGSASLDDDGAVVQPQNTAQERGLQAEERQVADRRLDRPSVRLDHWENRSAEERQADEELQALGLWEEDMTKEQKLEMLKVVAMSKETAKMEEAVRNCHYSSLSPPGDWFGARGASSGADAAPQGQMREEGTEAVITFECEEAALPPGPAKMDVQGQAKGPTNTSPQAMYEEADDAECWYGGFRSRQTAAGRSRQLYTSPTSRAMKPTYCMEHRLPLQWTEDNRFQADECVLKRKIVRRDERETSESGQHVPLFCPAGGNLREQTEAILESLSTLHRLLREQQRSLSLPLRPWGTPVGVGPHVKNSLDAAPPRGRRGQVTVSPGPPPELDEFPRLLPKNSNREVKPLEQPVPTWVNPPSERAVCPPSDKVVCPGGVGSAFAPPTWSSKRPRDPREEEVEDEAGNDPSPCSLEVASSPPLQ